MNGCNQYWLMVDDANRSKLDAVFIQKMRQASEHHKTCLKCAFGELNDVSNLDSRTRNANSQPAR